MMSPDGKRVGGGVHYGLGTFVRPTPVGGGNFWHWGGWTYTMPGAYDGPLKTSYSTWTIAVIFATVVALKAGLMVAQESLPPLPVATSGGTPSTQADPSGTIRARRLRVSSRWKGVRARRSAAAACDAGGETPPYTTSATPDREPAIAAHS